jgi:hypothetical protein
VLLSFPTITLIILSLLIIFGIIMKAILSII